MIDYMYVSFDQFPTKLSVIERCLMSCCLRRLSLLFVFVFLSVLTAAAEEIRPVKYVFLFIGDGMSIPQRMMAEEYLQKMKQRGLHINAMPHQALTTTRAANSFITDSAASGTAIACGEKTNNGFLGVGPDGTTRFESVAEVARDYGRKVGIITSVTLNHATPAAFYAHNGSRGNAYDIGVDFVASGFDYFGGGGFSGHDDTKAKNYRGDIYELAQKAGYTFSRTPEEFREIKPGVGKVLAIGAEGALPYALDTPPEGLRLADFTRQGIELLEDGPKGFFMMVEGGAIDWMCHANDAATTLGEIIEFDNAVAVALDFAAKHPEETLIVVTGDHETGGLTLGFAGTGYTSFIELLSNQKASSEGMMKAFQQLAEGDKTVSFEEIKPLITEKSGLIFADGERKKGGMNLTEAEEKELETAFEKSFEKDKPADGSILARAVVRLVNGKAGLGWTSNAHTALPVSTTALGPGAEQFSNAMDNTDIAKRLKQLVR